MKIPKRTWEDVHPADGTNRGPGWIPCAQPDGTPCKPRILCACGTLCGIGLHHVHADGRVTASFFHTKSGPHGDTFSGCEWHEFIELEGYDGPEFPPAPDSAPPAQTP